MKPDCVLAIQLAALLVIHCVWAADAPVFEAKDGQEVSQWKPWGDPGDEFVTLTQSVSAPKDGRSCLRVEMRVVPGTSWWPAVGFDFPVETSWANVGAVELWVRPEGAMPDGLLNMSVHAGAGILASTTLTGLKAGQWNAVSLSGAFTGVRQTGAAWRLKLAAQPSVVAQPTPIALSVDGLRLTRAAERPTQIEKLKDLRLNTLLVERGQPRAAIVAPGDGRYADAVAAVQAAVRQCAGIELPVQHDQAKTKDVLAATNVIAFGNTATNRFVETLYCEWYTMTDLWYPGKGGYEVRSLHNPYGTGRNVIFFGGSDDAGVLAAAREFAALLKPGDPLQVGWLMKIKLGDALKPPKPGEKIFSWHDSFRKDAGDQDVGYPPATYFAWNPISVQAALYYMTGQREYLDQFRRLALPDPKNIPIELRTDAAFNNPLKPLVENYHYRAHLVDVLWDLIEESPLFTDAERLAITNGLLEHQNHYDPSDSFMAKHGSRHGLWHMNCIYTGSRYFAKYYPHPRWDKRLANARESYASFIGDPTFGELDTLRWVNTSMEPVFDFFMMDGYEEFVRSGTTRRMISALEILWTGTGNEESNQSQSLSLMRKAAYLLKDGRYLHLADVAGYDLSVFRVGQSFTPPPGLKPEPPLDRVGRVSAFPLAQHDWTRSGKTVPLEQAFQFLSYRAGLLPSDDFMQLDGFYGRGRNPYHVNALYLLRMGGVNRLVGYESQVSVRRQGMVEPKVASAAGLESSASCGSAFYLRSTVPDMPLSSWTRRILYIKDLPLLVADEIRPREAGEFDVTCGWRTLGPARVLPDRPRCVQTNSGTTVACSAPTTVTLGVHGITQAWSGALAAGESFVLGNLIYVSPTRGQARFTIEPAGEPATNALGFCMTELNNSADAPVAPPIAGKPKMAELNNSAMRSRSPSFACFRPVAAGSLRIAAEAAYVSSHTLFAAGATELACDVPIMSAKSPVCFLWRLNEGVVEVDAVSPTSLALRVAGSGDMRQLELPAGRHVLRDRRLRDDAAKALAAALAGMKPSAPRAEPAQPERAAEVSRWQPVWSVKLEEGVTRLALSPHTQPETVWAVVGKQNLAALSLDGQVRHRVALTSPILSLWAAASPAQAKAFAALVGCDDDQVLAFSADGQQRWAAKAEVAPKFKIGDRWDAPWFSDPSQNHGVLSLLVGDLWGRGEEEIALGRACTVELRGLDGQLRQRIPTHWGNNTCLASLRPSPDPGPRLLVGKFYTGHAGVSVINSAGEVLTDGGYHGVPAGASDMSAWMQQGVSHLATADLDGDGAQEVVVARSGHWNELAVYAGKGGCQWVASFGPAASRSRFMAALAIADLDGDGRQELAVGMANGWLCVFDAKGAPRWQRRLPSAVTALAALGSRLAVGDAAGNVHLHSATGEPVATAKLDGAVTLLCSTPTHERLLVATATGELAAFRVEE